MIITMVVILLLLESLLLQSQYTSPLYVYAENVLFPFSANTVHDEIHILDVFAVKTCSS